MKSNQVIDTRLDGNVLTFTVKSVGELAFDVTKAHAANRAQAEFHGWIQRISDAAAIGRDPKTGASASPQQKFDAMKALVDHYESGVDQWSRVATAGPKGGYLFEALCEMFASVKSEAEVRTFLDGLTRREQDALREDDTVAPIIARIKAAKIKPEEEEARKETAKSLLAGLAVAASPSEEEAPKSE